MKKSLTKGLTNTKNMSNMPQGMSGMSHGMSNMPHGTSGMPHGMSGMSVISSIIAIIILLIIIAIVITINALALQWIYKLEQTNCKCSEDFKRDFMKYYIWIYFANIIFIFVSFISAALYVILIGKKSSSIILSILTGIYNIIKFIFPILSIINVIFSIMYIYNLKQIDCKCSEDIRREVYYIWNIISAAILGLNILFIIIMFVSILFMARK